jgi:hypothetical protein
MQSTDNTFSEMDQKVFNTGQGRWDMTVQTPDGEFPSWLEIRRSSQRVLVGQFVGALGSARPISRIDIKSGKLRFSIPPQFEPGSADLWVEGVPDGDLMNGEMGLPDGRRLNWTAKRAPVLRLVDTPNFGEPISLFNGIDLEGWEVLGDKSWEVQGGILRNIRTGGNLLSARSFKDFQLHIEYRYPASGNSGVYLRGRYEVQILDHPTPVPNSHDLGGIYGFLPPSDIVTNGPDAWNTFDITLLGRMVTIEANGKKIIFNQEIPGITGGALDSDEGAPGPLLLQGDHGPVDYRNITLKEVE